MNPSNTSITYEQAIKNAGNDKQVIANLQNAYKVDPTQFAQPNPTPNIPTSPVIPTTALKGTTQPVQLPTQTPTPTPQSGIADTTLSQAQTVATTQEPTPKETVTTGMKDLVSRITGTQAETAKIIDESGLAAKKKLATDLSNEMVSMDKAYRDEVTTIKENREGMFGGAVNQKLQEAQDRYYNRRANAAIVYNSALGDYNAVKEEVDLKIQAYKDQTTQSLQAYSTLFNMLQNDMSESEKLIAQEKMQEKGKLTDAYASVLQNATQNGASAATLNAIDAAAKKPNATIASIYSAAGRYGIDAYKAAQTAKLRAESLPSGNVVISGGTNTAKNQALQVILGSGKFTKDQKQSIISAINNGEDPLTVIKNQAKGLMSSPVATDVSKYEIARDSMKNIQEQLQQYYANGGKTNIFNGNFEKVINKLGTLNDPRLVDIATQIQSSLQVYRNAVSGTAYSVQEGKDIASIFPNINKTQGLNEAIINGRLKAFDSTINSSYKSVLGSSYDNLINSEPTTIQQKTTITPEDQALFNSVIPATKTQSSPYGTTSKPLFNLTSFFK